jgi:hypothetical protein
MASNFDLGNFELNKDISLSDFDVDAYAKSNWCKDGNSLTDNCVYKVYLTINDDIILSWLLYNVRSYLFMKTGIIMFLHIHSQRIFYYCHKVKDLCSPPLFNDTL